MTDAQINALSPTILAYIGDAVYELHVRQHLIETQSAPIQKLHKMAISHVNSSAQCHSFRQIEDKLTPQELAVYKRGRNTKSNVPKNSDMTEYRTATGLEALIGYLYLTNNEPRLNELISIILKYK